MKKIRDFLIGFLCLNVLWFLFSMLLDSRALPSPLQVYAAFGKVLESGIFMHIGMSLYRIFAGVGVSIAIGMPLGYAMAQSRKVDKLFHPFIYFTYPIPKTALLPVAMLLAGLGEQSKIAIMVLTMVFQVIITTRDAIMKIPESVYQVAVSTGKSGGFILRYITFPAILPDIFTGIRINLGTALAILLIVEAYGTKSGIGYYILDAWSRMNYNEMYGGIVVIAWMGAVLFMVMDMLLERVCRWKKRV